MNPAILVKITKVAVSAAVSLAGWLIKKRIKR